MDLRELKFPPRISFLLEEEEAATLVPVKVQILSPGKTSHTALTTRKP